MTPIEELHARYNRWHAQGVDVVRMAESRDYKIRRELVRQSRRRTQYRRDPVNKRPVLRGDGTPFPSVCAAADMHGVSEGAIRYAIQYETRVKGYEWRYAA